MSNQAPKKKRDYGRSRVKLALIALLLLVVVGWLLTLI